MCVYILCVLYNIIYKLFLMSSRFYFAEGDMYC